MPTGTQQKVDIANGKVDEIFNLIDSKFAIPRQVNPALDAELIAIETQVSAIQTTLDTFNTVTHDGIQGQMTDMNKQHMTACAALGMKVGETFDTLLKGIGALADGLIVDPIIAILDEILALLQALPDVNPDLSIINDKLNELETAIQSAIDAVGDILEALYEQSGLKDLANKVMGILAAIINCPEEFLDGLGGLGDVVLSMNPELKAAKESVDIAKATLEGIPGGGDYSSTDIMNIAKDEAVTSLNLDGQMSTTNQSILSKVEAITGVDVPIV